MYPRFPLGWFLSDWLACVASYHILQTRLLYRIIISRPQVAGGCACDDLLFCSRTHTHREHILLCHNTKKNKRGRPAQNCSIGARLICPKIDAVECRVSSGPTRFRNNYTLDEPSSSCCLGSWEDIGEPATTHTTQRPGKYIERGSSGKKTG